MRDTNEDADKKERLSDQNAGMIHEDLRELIETLDRCNRYLDIFFQANGIYDKAADMVLLQMLEGKQLITDTAL